MNQEITTHPEKETGALDITIAIHLIPTLLACGFFIFLASDKLSYWYGLTGESRFNPIAFSCYFCGALMLSAFVIIRLLVQLFKNQAALSRVEKWTLRILLAANFLITVSIFLLHEPGYKAHARGFAERVKTTLIINEQVRGWMRDQLRDPPEKSLPLSSSPEFIRAVFRETLAPWHHWDITSDHSGIVRFTTGSGFDEPWGLAVYSRENPPQNSTAKEYRVPIDDESFVFQMLPR